MNTIESIKVVRWGLLGATCAILLGFCLGGAFGGFEDPIQGWLKGQGEAVLAEVYGNNAQKLEQTLERAWHYLLRAHMHGGGIGSAALGLSLMLAWLPGSQRLRSILAGALGFGAIGYSSYWLLAGMLAPRLGSTGAAKEMLSWLAIPTAGALLLGVATTLGLIIWGLWGQTEAKLHSP